MSINSYLEKLSNDLIIRDTEKSSIKTSIETLEKRLGYYFTNIEESFCFGSYTRGTILPRTADSNSDIDYMIVFKRHMNGSKYTCEYVRIPLSEVANAEKKVPAEWIINNGTALSEEYVKYALPLIQGDEKAPLEDGLPRFARLKKVLVNKQ